MRWAKGHVLDLILVLCAITTTVAMVSRRAGSQRAEVGTGMHHFDGWEQDLAFNRRIGAADAPYRLVVWTDYQCPACKAFERQLDSARVQLKDSLAIVYRYYPLNIHPLAFKAAVAAECARAQGRFEAMHNALFATQLAGDSLPIASLISASGVADARAFRACLDDSTTVAVVRTDMERGKKLQLRGTPSLQIGDKIGLGGMMADELIPLLRAAQN